MIFDVYYGIEGRGIFLDSFFGLIYDFVVYVFFWFCVVVLVVFVVI